MSDDNYDGKIAARHFDTSQAIQRSLSSLNFFSKAEKGVLGAEGIEGLKINKSNVFRKYTQTERRAIWIPYLLQILCILNRSEIKFAIAFENTFPCNTLKIKATQHIMLLISTTQNI